MNDREFSDIETFELKKIGKVFMSKFVGPRALIL
jgi:hypothetical protein